MAPSSLGRMFLLFGVVLVVAGLMLIWGGKWPLLLGKLPGDFAFQSGRTIIYLPLTSSLLVSLLVSLLLRWLR